MVLPFSFSLQFISVVRGSSRALVSVRLFVTLESCFTVMSSCSVRLVDLAPGSSSRRGSALGDLPRPLSLDMWMGTFDSGPSPAFVSAPSRPGPPPVAWPPFCMTRSPGLTRLLLPPCLRSLVLPRGFPRVRLPLRA
jgi:hypothetical protein